MKRSFIILFIFLLIYFIGCKKSPTEVYPIEDNYMSLHVGDIRQFYLAKATDTSYALWKITGKAFRSDGQEVFISEWYINSLDSNSMYTYEFIRDGFYYGTSMDSTSDYPGNSYLEERLAPIDPFDGETFIQTIGVNNIDSSQNYNTVKYLGEYDTPAGKFKNVYNIIGNRGVFNSLQVKTYYAKNWGYLGIAYINSFNNLDLMAVVNYMKIDGKEIGKFVDMSKLTSKKYYLTSKIIIHLSPFGVFIN